jgi:hypothetical protein
VAGKVPDGERRRAPHREVTAEGVTKDVDRTRRPLVRPSLCPGHPFLEDLGRDGLTAVRVEERSPRRWRNAVSAF